MIEFCISFLFINIFHWLKKIVLTFFIVDLKIDSIMIFDLSGLCLTMESQGAPKLTIHGPPDVVSYNSSMLLRLIQKFY